MPAAAQLDCVFEGFRKSADFFPAPISTYAQGSRVLTGAWIETSCMSSSGVSDTGRVLTGAWIET